MRSKNIVAKNQLRLNMPKNMEFYNAPVPTPSILKTFKAIKCDSGGWFIYSSDISYVNIGMKVREKDIPSIVIDCDASNYDKLVQDGRFELTTPYLVSTKVVMGSAPVDIIHNKEFIGLDWVNSDGFVVFLRYK